MDMTPSPFSGFNDTNLFNHFSLVGNQRTGLRDKTAVTLTIRLIFYFWKYSLVIWKRSEP